MKNDWFSWKYLAFNQNFYKKYFPKKFESEAENVFIISKNPATCSYKLCSYEKNVF